MRQIVAAISQRQYAENKMHRRLISWRTRILCQFIAATIQVEEGKENSALDAAGKIVLDELETEELEIASRKADEKPIITDNAPGSYERLMASNLARQAAAKA